MTTQLVVGGLGLAVLGLLVWLAWSRGGAGARVGQAEGERDAATDQAERMAQPMPTKIERARAARRRLRELGMSDDEIDAALHRAADRRAARDPGGSA